jgi:NAD(P)-dependent dehydrogenase (short-subunit alcohol dehydrogenase family)
MEATALSEFENKVVLITGAASGIGRATALALSAAGAQLTLVDRDTEGLAETLQLAGGDGTRVLTSVVDVLVADQVRAAVDRTVEVFGRLDGAVNSAGIIGLQLPTGDYPDEIFQQLLQTNVFGMFLCIKAEAAAMARRGCGSIVNLASAAGLKGAPINVGYVTAKHAVVGLTRSAALSFAAQGIRVNAVCPGLVQTPMIADLAGFEAAIAAQHPLGRIAQPEEIADAALYLLSDRASFATGSNLVIDGGFSA